MGHSYSNLLLYDAVLSQIYTSRACRSADSDYLCGMGELLHTDSCIVIISQKDSHRILEASGVGVSRRSIESPASDTTQRLWSLDPALPFRDSAILLKEKVVRKQREYRDFFRRCLHPFQLASFISVNMAVNDQSNLCLRLARLQGRQDFDTNELEVAKTLARHLRAAYRSRNTGIRPVRDGSGAEALPAVAGNLQIGLAPIDTMGLERLFMLTPSEARVAALLIQGFSVDEVAGKLCKSRNTIRAHNRSLHAKLEVRSQAQLTWKILSSLAWDA